MKTVRAVQKRREGKIIPSKKENEKIFPIIDEKSFSEISEMSDEDEIDHSAPGNGMEELGINQQEIEINHFFNELPIRILNSHQFPFFYAEDVAKVLGFKSIRKGLANFTEKEIVSADLRKKYNIITYKKYKNGMRKDNKMILLTEFGVYRLIMTSRSQLADKFRDFIYDVLYQLRTAGEYKIKAELEQLQITNELKQRDIDRLQSKISQFKNLCDEIVLIEFPNDPYELLPSNVPKSMLKKSTVLRKKQNSIDDPVPHALRLAQELGKVLDLVDITSAPTTEWKTIHNDNISKAHTFIREYTPPNSYLVTSKPSNEQLTAGNVVHRVYVKDRLAAMRKLSALTNLKPDNVSSKGNWFSCDKQKIIEAMDAIVD